MKFRHVVDRLVPLLDDAHMAETLLDAEGSQFHRRAYVRSVFAMIEGTIWVLKQVILEAPTVSGAPKRLSIGECAMLADCGFDLTSSGEVRTQVKFVRLPENLRFTFRMMSKCFGIVLDLKVGTDSWNNLLKSQAIRNRITHPKTTEDYKIDDDEIQFVRDASSWFNDLVVAVANGISKNATERPAGDA